MRNESEIRARIADEKVLMHDAVEREDLETIKARLEIVKLLRWVLGEE